MGTLRHFWRFQIPSQQMFFTTLDANFYLKMKKIIIYPRKKKITKGRVRKCIPPMELMGIFHPPDLHRALLLYPFFWIFLSNFFLVQYPFHVSLPPHHHIHSMKMQPYPLREEKWALRNDIEDIYKRRVAETRITPLQNEDALKRIYQHSGSYF